MGIEGQDLVEATDELGPEELAQLALAPQVARQQHQGLGEVHRASLTVRQATVVEHLQQRVEHVRVGLLDLVQQ